jgi:hypothetical protein
MKSGSLALNGVFAASVAVLWLLPADVAGQGRARSNKPAAKEAAAAQRTPWGDPDLQGLWTNTTTTPLERLAEASTKTVLTEEERQTLAQQVAERLDQDKPPARAGTIVPYNEFWYERGTLTNRTSLIIDPPDGKIPPFTPAAQKRWQEQLDARKEHPADSWLDRSAYDRCISRGMPGTMLPGFYNHNYEIVQAPGYVAILVEMIHDTRIIPLDGRPHMNGTVRQWLGDPRGHWEGNTLVVETTNFNDKMFERGAATGFGAGVRMIERIRRIGADQLDYELTVEDPATFTRPWTVSTPMIRTDGPLFEYACHEGNYAMRGILAGARAAEKAAEQAAGKQPR